MSGQRVVQHFLEQLGCSIEMCDDGSNVLTMVELETFELILLDLRMSGMDGFDAALAIRAFEAERGAKPVPIAAVSANVDPRSRTRCDEVGIDGFMTKPISLARLEALIHKHVPAAQTAR